MSTSKAKHARHASESKGAAANEVSSSAPSAASASSAASATSTKAPLRRMVSRGIGVLAVVAVALACALSAERMGLVSFGDTGGTLATETKDLVAQRSSEAVAKAMESLGGRATELMGLSGWVQGSDGEVYYYDETTHQRAKGWLDLSDGRYYLDEQTGAMQLGWCTIDGQHYWFDDGSGASRGTLVRGTWLERDEGRYLLSEEGPAVVGWHEIDGQTYCFDENGLMKTGWADVEDGTRRWLKSDGTMATNEWIEMDDGVWQVFDVDGTWVTQDEIIPPDDATHVAEMSARQHAVVNACDVTPWPGKALCARWVSDVFINAGEGAVGGDACDIANTWCISSDLSDLRPGMVIAVPSHPRTDNGKIWGHVCIYVGNGYVRDSGTYGVRRVELSTWFAWFGASNTPKWGWANGVSLA